MRSRSQIDPAAFEQMLRDLRDPSLPPEFRQLVALVLGTLENPRAQEALAAALAESKNNEWSIILLHALGAEKVGAADDEIFDLPDSPFVYEISGLRLTVRMEITAAPLRQSLSGWLDHEALEVRRAALRALIHSTRHADLRRRFLESIPRETDENLRAGYGHALATWIAGTSADSQERGEVLRAVLEAALLPGNAALRFRIEGPLGGALLPPAELSRVAESALQPPVERQLWSLTLLSRQAPAAPETVEEVCRRLISPASDEKVREYAARSLGAIRTGSCERALIPLLSDPSWNVRLAAIEGLAGRPGAAIALTQASSADPDERVRKAALKALGK